MSDNNIEDLLDKLLTPIDSTELKDREDTRCARFRAARKQLEPYFHHELLEPLERELTWGIVDAGLELALARSEGGVEALTEEAQKTKIDERFEPLLEALNLMLDWCRGIANGSMRGSVERVVLHAMSDVKPSLRFFRAVAGLLVVGIDDALPADVIARELAPVFREKTSIFPSKAELVRTIKDDEIESIGRLEYSDDSIGFRVGEFGARPYQQSVVNPDLVYVLDEFLTLLEVNLEGGRSRVIAELYGPLTRRRRDKLRSRGVKVNKDYPMEHIFFFEEESGILYLAAHTRLFEVWDVRSRRQLYSKLLPDQSYAIDQIGPGRVRVAVRGNGFMELDGRDLRAGTGGFGAGAEFVARTPLEWNGFAVYILRDGLLFAGRSGEQGGVLKLPGEQRARVASVCLLTNEFIVTTWDRDIHMFRGSGLPWQGWTVESRTLAHYVCVAPDAPWGVVFDRHTTSTAWSGPWSYQIVDDVRTVDERCERSQVIEQRGLVQSIPEPLRHGRLTFWNESSLTATMDVGTRYTISGRMRVQHLGPAYQESLSTPDGSLVALRDWLNPCSLAVADAHGHTIARTEFPSVQRLVSLDPESETLTVRGRAKSNDELTIEELDGPPVLALWSWHWPSNSWTSSPAKFHGYRSRVRTGRCEERLYLAGNRELNYLGSAGISNLILEEKAEEELIIVNDAIRRLNGSTGEMQIHPFRPLLCGRTLNEVTVEISTATDRIWMVEPGGIVNGYSLHDAKRLWRIRLPGVAAASRAQPLKLSCVPGMRHVLSLRMEDGQVFLLDAESGDLVLTVSFESEQRDAGFLPVLTRDALLVPIGYEAWAWPLSKELRSRLTLLNTDY